MLDHLSLRLAKPYLDSAAARLKSWGVMPNQVSVAGFVIGMAAGIAIAFQYYVLGLLLLLLNRLADGLDGPLARLNKPTDCGAYLDITLDFIFYSAIVFSFAVANPEKNGLAAAALLFSFVGTGSSFLAFAIQAERRKMKDLRLPGKGFYYLGGLAEGTETIVFFVLFCLFPEHFSILAWIFATLCYLTTGLRVLHGYKTFKDVV